MRISFYLSILLLALALTGCGSERTVLKSNLSAAQGDEEIVAPPPGPSSSPVGSPSPNPSPGQSPSPTPVPVPPPPAPLPPGPRGDYSFDVPTEFVSPDPSGKFTRVTKLNVPKNEVFKKLVIRGQFFLAKWNTFTDPQGNLHHSHALFWLTRGGKWGSHVVGYPTAKENNKKMKLGSNIDVVPANAATQGNTFSYAGFLHPGRWYNMEYIYDAPNRVMTLNLYSDTGASWTMQSPSPSTNTVLTNPYDFYSFHFGQAASVPGGGPEASSDQWRLRNLTADFFR